jgi:hypothetical protein
MPEDTPSPGHDEDAATPRDARGDGGAASLAGETSIVPDGSIGPGEPADAGPCAAEARIAEERCALADRLQVLLEIAIGELRATQRDLDLHELRMDRAVAVADPRAVRDRKDAAYAAFRSGRASAQDHGGLEAAAAIWLAEIDRVNREVSAARRIVAGGQREAGRLLVEREKRTVAADAARIAAERADRACLDARGRLAACVETAAGGAAPGLGEILGTRPATPRAEPVADAAGPEAGTAPEADATALRRPDAHPAMIAILAGDAAVRDAVATSIAGDDTASIQRWSDRLARLADAIVDVAVEDSRFVFPRDHPFWGIFSQDECREIAMGLAALGYRPRPGGGWLDDRIPSRRDLSLAVGYAGHDPMRIRNGPTDDALAHLADGIEVNVIGHLVATAGGLTLGEMVALLGRRAEGSTDLWAAWGRIRPLLLSDVEAG